jgi:transcriptional regulator with XRE-family HTH domain
MTDIGSRLRTIREQRKIPQVEVAVAVGISRSTLSKYETGGDVPGRDTLIKLADFYGVPIDFLAARTGENMASGAGRAQTDDESLWLWAYRSLPKEEAEAHLNLILRRVKKTAD